MRLLRGVVVVLAVMLLGAPSTHAQECNTTFLDALDDSDTWLFKKGIELAGFADKLPSPSIGVTVLVPTNKAWTRFILRNGFKILGGLGSIGDKLVSIMTYHIFPQTLPPDAVTAPDEAQAGQAQTLLTLLTGQPYPLKYWRLGPEDDNQILFKGLLDGTVAGVSENPIQVCNSWVYVVDEVLLPGDGLGDVPEVQLPETNPLNPPAPQPAPAPAPAAPEEAPAPEPEGPPCNVSWAQAAKQQQGLSLLATVLGQDAIASKLPGPGQANTLFAPTDAAFFNMLATLKLSINDALALGDKLVGVILYHASPGAVGPEALAKATSLPTLLGEDYRIGVASDAAGKATLSGLFPGNRANVTASLTVCNAQVYVIDSVLIPAASVDQLPSPSQAQLPAPKSAAASEAPAGQAAAAAVQGWATGAGYIAGCQVELDAPSPSNATSNASGWFSLPCKGGGAGCQAPRNAGVWLVRVPGGQGENCTDATTGLPLLYSMQLATPTIDVPLTVNPVSTLQSALFLTGSGADWSQLNKLVAQQLGIPYEWAITQGNPVEGALGGNGPSLAVQAAGAQLQCLVGIGAPVLAGAQPGASGAPLAPDAIALAIYAAVGREMEANKGGSPLDMANATLVASILSEAQNSLQQGNRDERPQGEAVGAAAAPIALLNEFVAQALGTVQAGEPPGRVVLVLSRAVAVAQAEVAPAARQLGEGKLEPSQFSGKFSEEGLLKLIQTAGLG